MGRIDKPWGYEEQVLVTQVEVGGKTGMLGMRKLVIDADEMTSYAYHDEQSDVIYHLKGNVTIRKDEELEELESGGAVVIRAGEKHQIQNLGPEVAEVLEISFPYRPDDISRVEDPYESERED